MSNRQFSSRENERAYLLGQLKVIDKEDLICEQLQRLVKELKINKLANRWQHDACEALTVIEIPPHKPVKLMGESKWRTFDRVMYSVIEGWRHSRAGIKAGRNLFQCTVREYREYIGRLLLNSEINSGRSRYTFAETFQQQIEAANPAYMSYVENMIASGYLPIEVVGRIDRDTEGLEAVLTHKMVFDISRISNHRFLQDAVSAFTIAGIGLNEIDRLAETLGGVLLLLKLADETNPEFRLSILSENVLSPQYMNKWRDVNELRVASGKMSSGNRAMHVGRALLQIYTASLARTSKFHFPSDVTIGETVEERAARKLEERREKTALKRAAKRK